MLYEDLIDRLRSVMPEESPVDLDQHARLIALTVLHKAGTFGGIPKSQTTKAISAPAASETK